MSIVTQPNYWIILLLLLDSNGCLLKKTGVTE